MRQIQSAQQRLGMAMDYYLANRSRRFTQIFSPSATATSAAASGPSANRPRTSTPTDGICAEARIKQATQRQQRVSQRLSQQNPQPRIHRAQSRIQQLEYRLTENIRSRLSEQRERFGNAVTHLEAVSPLATLARGYTVSTTTNGKVLKRSNRSKQAIS